MSAPKGVLQGAEALAVRAQAARVALAATILLTFFKFAVALYMGSVGVLSEAIHSLLDLLSAGIAFFTVRAAVQPADQDHPYGHGKFETVSSLFEALLLFAAAGFVVWEGWRAWLNPAPLQHEWLAIAVMGLSLLASYLVYRHNIGAARATESRAIEANAIHFLADVVTSGGVLAGLIAIYFTGLQVIDALMAFGIAAYILFMAVKLVKAAIAELVDVQLPAEELADLDAILARFKPKVIGVHELRTRRSGSHRHIDFHLSVCGDFTVNQSHFICDEMEDKIMERFPAASVNIHVEPCSQHDAKDCHSVCQFTKKPRIRA
ncbi:MAG: cation diffusion facilitator family transporter [Bacteriovoracia bacterium]